MDGSAILAFWGVSILFVITPGADWAYAITSGLAKNTVPAVLGMLTGHLVATVIVAAGIGGLVAGMPAALTVLTIAGSLYLIWLGISTVRHAVVVPSAENVDDGSWRRLWLKGFGVSGLNPKVFLLFLAILPQFVRAREDWPVGAQIVALGLVHVASCCIVYFAVSFGADAVLSSRPVAARIVSRVSGIAMIAIGLFLFVERMLVL